jgi:hypothetical protein
MLSNDIAPHNHGDLTEVSNPHFDLALKSPCLRFFETPSMNQKSVGILGALAVIIGVFSPSPNAIAGGRNGWFYFISFFKPGGRNGWFC